MGDLENLWDDYPTGPAPTDDILRAARRAAMRDEARQQMLAEATATSVRRRRLLGRPLVAAAAVTGLAAALVVGFGVGRGGPGGPGGQGTGDARPAAFQADLKPAKSCADLLASYHRRGLKLVTAYGWSSPEIYNRTAVLAGSLGGPLDALPHGYAPEQVRAAGSASIPLSAQKGLDDAPTTRAQLSSPTGTNVQEAGVDEPDTVKTDGRILAQLRDDELWLYDVSSGRTATLLSSTRVDSVDKPEMLLAGHTIVVIGGDNDAVGARSTRVLTFDIAEPHSPKQTHDVVYRSSLLSARQHGDAIRLVLSTGLPRLHFTRPHRGVSAQEALAANRRAVRQSTIADWLPTARYDAGDAKQLLDCTNVAVPDDELGLDTVSVVGFEADAPATVDAIGLAGATDLAYESTDHLYLVASPAPQPGTICQGRCVMPLLGQAAQAGPSGPLGQGTHDGNSYIFDFAINGDHAINVASGEVEGDIRDRWSMDEVDGVLRVAVGPTRQTGNFNSIITLRKRGQDLVELGRIDHIGHGEDIESARWFDDLAVLTTYRNTDPMFTIDLSHPAHPRLLGMLRLPGYSSYLHPLGRHRIIGVGTGPGGNTQVGLFDTTHLSHVVRLDEAHFRHTSPLAATDPRTFTWVPRSRTAYTVVQRYAVSRIGYLATLKVRHSHFVTRLDQVEYGDDVGQVRAVPLGHGRVVLTTGDNPVFLPLPR